MRPALSRGWPAPGASSHPHAPTHEADGPAGRVPAGECDGRGSRGPRGRCIRHAPEATPRAVGPLVVPVIEPAFRAALMPRVRALPLAPLRGRAAGLPTVGLPPPAGPTEGEHRRAPRPAAPHRAPPLGSGAHAGPPQRLRRVRGRRGVTGETDRPAGEDGGASFGGLRSRAHESRRLRDRKARETAGTSACLCAPDRTSRRARAWRQAQAAGSYGARHPVTRARSPHRCSDGDPPAIRTRSLARPRSARPPVPSRSSPSPIAPARGHAGTGSGSLGGPVLSADGGPSRAPGRVAITRTVYVVPLVRLSIVWRVVDPGVTVACRSPVVSPGPPDLHCTV